MAGQATEQGDLRMRVRESVIKEAILHPNEEIRNLAVEYFTDSFTSDTTIMPLVIQAVEQYGDERGIRILRALRRLPQSGETLDWLVEELQADNRLDSYRFALATVICS